MKLSYLYGALESMKAIRDIKLSKHDKDYNPNFDDAIKDLENFINEAENQETIYVQMSVENDYKRQALSYEI